MLESPKSVGESGRTAGRIAGWRKIKGQEVLRGKFASERFSEREGLQKFSEVFRGFSEALSEPLSECHFLSELRAPLPLIVLPLK